MPADPYADLELGALSRYPVLVLAEGNYIFIDRDERGSSIVKGLSPADVALAFSGVETDTHWIDPHVMRWMSSGEKKVLVVSIPAKTHTLVLTAPRIRRVLLPLPPLVLVLTNGESYCFAMKRIAPDEVLFNAPLPNVSTDSGRICWGDVKLPNVLIENAAAFVIAFLKSEFTLHSIEGKSKKHMSNIHKMLMSLKGKQAYPLNDLTISTRRRGDNEVQMSLAEFVEGLC